VTYLPNYYPFMETKLLKGGIMTLCEGGSYELGVEPESEHYLWSTEDSSSVIMISDSGSYFVRVVDIEGCISHSDTLHVVIVASELGRGNYFTLGDTLNMSTEGEAANYEASPYNNHIPTRRMQIIYKADELIAAG